MTPEQAEHILEQGCPHNPWTEEVCPNCAKDILEVFHNLRTGTSGCKTCGDPNHSTREHIDWTMGDNDDISGDW